MEFWMSLTVAEEFPVCLTAVETMNGRFIDLLTDLTVYAVIGKLCLASGNDVLSQTRAPGAPNRIMHQLAAIII